MAGEIEAAAAAATAQLAEMKTAYEASPQRQLERDREELARLENDPHHLNARLTNERAQQDIAAIKSRIAVAEAGAEAAVAAQVLTDAQRVDLALQGESFRGPQSTIEGQIPASDFADAIRDDIALGLPASLVRRFHSTGRSDDRLGHVNAKFWLDRFNSDAEMQKKFAAGDAVMRMRFRAAHIYLNGKHPDVSAEEEAAELARLRQWDN